MLVNRATAPASGTRRSHVVLGVAQVFSDGVWLPQVHVVPSAAACRNAMRDAPTAPFHEGRFAPALGATYPLAHLAAVARACQRITGFDLTIKAQAAGDRPDILNRQLARRRAGGGSRSTGFPLAIGGGLFPRPQPCRQTGGQQIAPGWRVPADHLARAEMARRLFQHQIAVQRIPGHPARR